MKRNFWSFLNLVTVIRSKLGDGEQLGDFFGVEHGVQLGVKTSDLIGVMLGELDREEFLEEFLDWSSDGVSVFFFKLLFLNTDKPFILDECRSKSTVSAKVLLFFIFVTWESLSLSISKEFPLASGIALSNADWLEVSVKP